MACSDGPEADVWARAAAAAQAYLPGNGTAAQAANTSTPPRRHFRPAIPISPESASKSTGNEIYREGPRISPDGEIRVSTVVFSDEHVELQI